MFAGAYRCHGVTFRLAEGVTEFRGAAPARRAARFIVLTSGGTELPPTS